MNKRKDVVEFILELEKKFNVNLWKINNIKKSLAFNSFKAFFSINFKIRGI